ncbi:MAG: glyoxalase, partial [Marivirga sp.]|nr:glyoxalase [Marivirga sp.]
MKKNKGSQSTMVNPIPEGYHTVTPFIIADGATKLMDFISKAFDGEVTSEMKGDNNTIMHATMKIGDSTIMIADTMENF